MQPHHDLTLFWGWGISLSWLLFGIGNRSNYQLCIPQEAIKISQIGPEDREFVRLKYGWDTSDSLWFFGAAAPHRKNSAVSRVLIRLLAAFPVTQILPEPEDIMIESGYEENRSCDWIRTPVLPPFNAATGHRYTGINRMLLSWVSWIKDWNDPRFVTYHQCESMVWKWSRNQQKLNADGCGNIKKVFINGNVTLYCLRNKLLGTTSPGIDRGNSKFSLHCM